VLFRHVCSEQHYGRGIVSSLLLKVLDALLLSGMRHQPGKLAIVLVGLGMEVMMVNSDPDGKSESTDKMIGSCRACKKGFFQMCDNGVVNGETKGGGCMYSCSKLHNI
jgi:hypothetical protein